MKSQVLSSKEVGSQIVQCKGFMRSKGSIPPLSARPNTPVSSRQALSGYNKTSPALPGRLSRTELDSSGSSRLPTATEIATTEYVVADPALAAVVEAWPDLPEAIKAGILAMVKASRQPDARIRLSGYALYP